MMSPLLAAGGHHGGNRVQFQKGLSMTDFMKRFERATCGTIRLQLLKIGALVTVSVRRVKLAFASPPLPT